MLDNRENKGNMALAFMGGAIAGAAAMALMDPGRGAKRRSLVRDKAVRGAKVIGTQGGKQVRNARYHVQGSFAEIWSATRDRFREIGDETLLARVRAQVGHVLQNAKHMFVHVKDGHVIVEGSVRPGEIDKVRQRLRETRGVRSFEVHLKEDLDRVIAAESGGISRVG